MNEIPPLNGLVLAGGHSRRMGIDKALIDYHGKPQGQHLFDALHTVCQEVYTSCRKEQVIHPLLNPLPDIMEIQSPLNGILSAFHRSPDRAWLVVAVDLPNVSADVLREIVSRRDHRKLATCLFDAVAGAPEPLLTIWEPAAHPPLSTRAAGGDISPRSFLMHHHVHIVYGMDESIFLNINDVATRDTWQAGSRKGESNE